MAAEHMVDVEVLTPEGEVWSGEARQVSTRTEVGEVGILANHVPLLARLAQIAVRVVRRDRIAPPAAHDARLFSALLVDLMRLA